MIKLSRLNSAIYLFHAVLGHSWWPNGEPVKFCGCHMTWRPLWCMWWRLLYGCNYGKTYMTSSRLHLWRHVSMAKWLMLTDFLSSRFPIDGADVILVTFRRHWSEIYLKVGNNQENHVRMYMYVLRHFFVHVNFLNV
jgi:hypothetical protein